MNYIEVDGELELLPGLRLLPAPGHTRGSQSSSSTEPQAQRSSPVTRQSGSTNLITPAPTGSS